MASSEKSQVASAKRLQTLREQGVTINATELASAIGFVISLIVLLIFLPEILEQIKTIKKTVWTDFALSDDAYLNQIYLICYQGFIVFVPLLCLIMLGATAMQYGMKGYHFNFKLLLPKLSRVSFRSYFQRIFKLETVFHVLKLLLSYVLLLFAIGVVLFQWYVTDLTQFLQEEGLLKLLKQHGLYLFGLSTAVMLLIAAMDYLMAFFTYQRETKMTVEECRREQREQNIPQEIKQAIQRRR